MKRLCYFFLLFSLPLFLSLQCFAAKYTADMPSYVPYSGGAYFEIVDKNLGTVTCLFPIEFKDNTFGFNDSGSGTPSNIVNLTNSTINGVLITSNGTQYTCRASRFSEVEYRLTSSSSYTTIRPVLAGMNVSNIDFVTDDQLYANEGYFNYKNVLLVCAVFCALCEAGSLAANLLRRGYR